MNIYEKPVGAETRWFSPENPGGEPGKGGLENSGSKGRPFIPVENGETVTLMDYTGSGTICRMWFTINDRSPEMLRGLRIEMYWDGQPVPAVSVPFGDFFGIGLGRTTSFECALFSNPEGRSFNCFVPMPFRRGAKVTVTNESGKRLGLMFYDIDVVVNVRHSLEMLYLHAGWRRNAPNKLGEEFVILPEVSGRGKFLGCNLGIITDEQYGKSWWGEGEVKCRMNGEQTATLCGTGTEDYIGTGWGQGAYAHRTQGCPIADSERRHWAFYRYHIDDPVYFEGSIQVSIQTIGGTGKEAVIEMQQAHVPLIPTTLDAGDEAGMVPLMPLPQPVDLASLSTENAWCNFWRQDDWSGTAYFYLDQPGGVLPELMAAEARMAGLADTGKSEERADN